ncbi:MAG: SDR family NAD(P)-dependent oxidoreductase [Nitrospinae bacterium]|nr:SDR family NAD(P)-dependent oxidoreductase [Nitrospinota bacterium]
MNYKVAVVTGASSGIGRAIAGSLAKQNVRLILIARRQDKLEQLKRELHTEVHVIVCDITRQQEVSEALKNVPDEFAKIDVLINCAGLALGLDVSQEADWSDWETMVNVNCTALSFLTHLLLPGMVDRDLGHIINIGSTAGTYPYKGANVYGATKAYVKHFTLNLKADLLGTSVRVTSIEPGMVSDSEFSLVRFKGDEEKANAVYEGLKALSPSDISESVLWVLTQPAHVNINRMEIMPVSQAPGHLANARKGKK